MRLELASFVTFDDSAGSALGDPGVLVSLLLGSTRPFCALGGTVAGLVHTRSLRSGEEFRCVVAHGNSYLVGLTHCT